MLFPPPNTVGKDLTPSNWISVWWGVVFTNLLEFLKLDTPTGGDALPGLRQVVRSLLLEASRLPRLQNTRGCKTERREGGKGGHTPKDEVVVCISEDMSWDIMFQGINEQHWSSSQIKPLTQASYTEPPK